MSFRCAVRPPDAADKVGATPRPPATTCRHRCNYPDLPRV
jgi:hypothetical protein